MENDIGTNTPPQDQPFGNVSGERSDSCTHGSYSLGIKGEAIVHFCTRCKQTWPMGAPLPRGKSQITWPKIGDKITLTRTDGEPAYDYVGSGGYVDTLAFSPPTTEGEDNLTQPSSGEQPTSVRDVFAELHGHNYHDEYSELAWEKWLTEAEQRVKTFCAEERRQAKIEILEELLDTRRPQVIGWEATIESYLTEFKELRGENNE